MYVNRYVSIMLTYITYVMYVNRYKYLLTYL